MGRFAPLLPEIILSIGGTILMLAAAFAGEPHLELCLERVQVDDVGGGVGELGLAQRIGGPVRALLLLGKLDAEKLAHQVLEAVPISVGPGEARGDLRAVKGAGHDAPTVEQDGDVEAREMEDF